MLGILRLQVYRFLGQASSEQCLHQASRVLAPWPMLWNVLTVTITKMIIIS